MDVQDHKPHNIQSDDLNGSGVESNGSNSSGPSTPVRNSADSKQRSIRTSQNRSEITSSDSILSTDSQDDIGRNSPKKNAQATQQTVTQTNSQQIVEKDDTNPDTSQTDSSTDAFAKLNYHDVQINLRLLSDIKENEKIRIFEGRHMKVDQRYIQGVCRYWTNDSRDRTLRFIDHVINSTREYCNEAVQKIRDDVDKQDNMTKLINLQKLLDGSKVGLGRLKITYGDDKHNRATIETYEQTIHTFCDQDLKKAIAANQK